MTTQQAEQTPDSISAGSIGQIFGLDHLDPVESDTGEATPEASDSDPATPILSQPADKAEKPDAPEEPPIRGLNELREVAKKRAAQRESHGIAETKVRELEAQIAELRQSREPPEVAAFRQLQQLARTSPIEALETLGIDVVSFLQNGHRQALDRSGHAQARTMEELRAEIRAAKEELAELKSGVPKRFEEEQRAAQQQANQREFFALTADSDVYPLLSHEDYADQLHLAGQAVALLTEAGYTNITHRLVADTVEKTLRDDYERRATALGRATTGKSPETKSVPASGEPTARGRRSTGTTGAATLTNQMAAEGTNDRPMTEREREAEGRRIVSKIFGVPER